MRTILFGCVKHLHHLLASPPWKLTFNNTNWCRSIQCYQAPIAINSLKRSLNNHIRIRPFDKIWKFPIPIKIVVIYYWSQSVVHYGAFPCTTFEQPLNGNSGVRPLHSMVHRTQFSWPIFIVQKKWKQTTTIRDYLLRSNSQELWINCSEVVCGPIRNPTELWHCILYMWTRRNV